MILSAVKYYFLCAHKLISPHSVQIIDTDRSCYVMCIITDIRSNADLTDFYHPVSVYTAPDNRFIGFLSTVCKGSVQNMKSHTLEDRGREQT